MNNKKSVAFWNDRPTPKDFPWQPMHELIWQSAGGKSLAVLDLAAGNGALSIPLLQKECDVTATELGPKLLRHLEGIQSPGGKKIHALEEDVRQADPAPAAFDLVICSCILHFLSLADGKALLEKIRTAVKPGGLVWLRWFTPEGELVLGYDHCVLGLKQMVSLFPGATVLSETMTTVPTATLRPDKTPMTHVAGELLLRI